MVSYMALSILVPLVAVVRFVLLSPIAWCSPRDRHWIHQHMSSTVMNPSYIHPAAFQRTRRILLYQEVG